MYIHSSEDYINFVSLFHPCPVLVDPSVVTGSGAMFESVILPMLSSRDMLVAPRVVHEHFLSKVDCHNKPLIVTPQWFLRNKPVDVNVLCIWHAVRNAKEFPKTKTEKALLVQAKEFSKSVIIR